MKKHHLATIILLLLFSLTTCQRVVRGTNQQKSQEVKYELAQLTTDNPQQIIEHLGYTVSFNSVWNIPNWVAYSLTRAEAQGTVQRDKNFYPDPDIKTEPVTKEDYNGVGKIEMSRGHMAPAGDMKWSVTAMQESCYMTNICPQNRNLNNGDWKELEEHIRYLADKYGEIYVTCGPIVSPDYNTIGNSKKIAIPDAFYKVLLRKTPDSWTAIGFLFPNKAGNKSIMEYSTTVDNIEKLTGIDFFYSLPDDIEYTTEAKIEIKEWY